MAKLRNPKFKTPDFSRVRGSCKLEVWSLFRALPFRLGASENPDPREGSKQATSATCFAFARRLLPPHQLSLRSIALSTASWPRRATGRSELKGKNENHHRSTYRTHSRSVSASSAIGQGAGFRRPEGLHSARQSGASARGRHA